MPFRNGNNPANKKTLDEEKIRALYRSGLSTNKIGPMLGCSKGLIVRVIKRHNELRFGRLSPEQRSKAVDLYASGLSGPAVAEQIGVCSPAVYLALKKHDRAP